MRRPVVLAMLLVVVLSFAFALPAYADGPERFTLPAPLNADIDASVCGFPIDVVDTGAVTFMLWSDDAGVAIREMQVYGRGEQTYTANGKTLISRVTGPIHATMVSQDLVMGTSVWDLVLTGVTRHVTVPGAGFADGFAGRAELRVTFDTLDASGNWMGVDWNSFYFNGMWGDNPDALCAYFAQ